MTRPHENKEHSRRMRTDRQNSLHFREQGIPPCPTTGCPAPPDTLPLCIPYPSSGSPPPPHPHVVDMKPEILYHPLPIRDVGPDIPFPQLRWRLVITEKKILNLVRGSFPVIHKVDNVDNFVQSSSNENTLEVVN